MRVILALAAALLLGLAGCTGASVEGAAANTGGARGHLGMGLPF